MKKGYAVKFETKEIIVTKRFLRDAEVFGTEEFKILLDLTKELPNFLVRTRRIQRNYNCSPTA